MIVLAVGIFLFRQTIIDTIAVYTYQPTSETAALASRAHMSGRGEFLYLASRPQLLEREPFNAACQSVATEKTAVLGCYAMGRIYVFNIEDKKLDGVREVTAAHEMLHAAYVRLPGAERRHIDALLEAQLANLGDDAERIEGLMTEYAKTEPGEKYNELHSILGTELVALSPELEKHYAQYFTERTRLVATAQAYQSVFDELKSQQDTLVSEMTTLADTIDARSETYRANVAALERDVESFNARATSGTMTRTDYDRERAALLSRKAAVTSDYDRIQEIISQYNQKRQELMAINAESETLNRSLNSALRPVAEGME